MNALNTTLKILGIVALVEGIVLMTVVIVLGIAITSHMSNIQTPPTDPVPSWDLPNVPDQDIHLTR